MIGSGLSGDHDIVCSTIATVTVLLIVSSYMDGNDK